MKITVYNGRLHNNLINNKNKSDSVSISVSIDLLRLYHTTTCYYLDRSSSSEFKINE
jgi:hypothetical protein